MRMQIRRLTRLTNARSTTSAAFMERSVLRLQSKPESPITSAPSVNYSPDTSRTPFHESFGANGISVITARTSSSCLRLKIPR